MKNKVLVISCNCMSQTSSNGKTLANFFQSENMKNVAQFYTYDEIPDFPSQCAYYRITDREMIALRCGGSKNCGNQISDYCKASPSAPLRKMRFENAKRFARELIWYRKNWIDKGLLKWIDDYSPEYIFFVGINNVYLYDLCLFLQKRYGIPVEIYITDDYLHGRYSLSLFYWLRLLLLRNRFFKLCRGNTAVITINEVMQREYQKMMGKPCRILTNYVTADYKEYSFSDRSVKCIAYVGNLLHGRWKALLSFAESLEGLPYEIYVYPGKSIDEEVRNKLTKCSNIHIGGYLGHSQVTETINSSDYVLHIESFRYSDVCLARYSLSTKITEYAACCKPIIYYCPEEVASFQVLQQNDLGICFNENNITGFINDLNDEDKLKKVVHNAFHYFYNQYLQYDMENEIENIYDELRN